MADAQIGDLFVRTQKGVDGRGVGTCEGSPLVGDQLKVAHGETGRQLEPREERERRHEILAMRRQRGGVRRAVRDMWVELSQSSFGSLAGFKSSCSPFASDPS